MSRTVFCKKLQKEAEGLSFKPYPGELGEKIYNEISQEAWTQWLNHQTMLINEKRLSLMDPQAQSYLAEQMEMYLFGGDYEKPEGYVPEEDK
ncbi:oxidative damage protection protein [Kangiella profundi]|uniref:Probable Fe(2+)-trafficking protein n=2 Tax=Kangiella TaxID=261963 RepID=A0A2K9ABV1_9GAMM|nr:MULTISPECIES: oxidative damage protection protein [Kangiella]AUD77846.1 oxidative damage protection protein [Kangiella profundi]WQG85479.1 oxidative damage protection protein [Kangiella aquimarina]GGE92015.1 putative Fe(2+)-trafficking protein [Kangiella profundi]